MSKKRRARYWIGQLHLWLGLTVGVYFVILGITGSLLVFAEPLDRWLNPALRHVEPVGEEAPFSRILGTFRDAYPDDRVMRIVPPEGPEESWSFWIGTIADLRQVYIDPYRLTVLGERPAISSLVGFCRYVHFFLLLGGTGWLLNGVLGLVTLLVLATGLVLWWPRTVKQLGSRLWVKWRARAARVNWDVHNAIGVWTLPIMVVIVLTGAYFPFSAFVRPVVYAALGPEGPEETFDVGEAAGGTPVSVDDMLASIAEMFPSARLARITSPDDPARPLKAIIWEPGDEKWYTFTEVEVDRATGQVSLVHRATTTSDYVLRAMYPLHAGTFGGVWTKALYVVLGLLPAILFGTGVAIWLRRQWLKRAARTRTASRAGFAELQPGGAA